MKKLILFGLLIFLTGCVNDSPINTFVNISKHSGFGSGGIVDNNVPTTKTGLSVCRHILFFTYGDCSIEKAQEIGKITKVHSVSHETQEYMFMYGTYTTKVIGE
jgi:hypothetical protein